MQVLKKLLIIVYFGIYFFFIAAFLVPNRGNPDARSIEALALISFGWLFPVIAVHELGHLLAARIARFRTLALAVGPLEITFPNSGQRVTFNLLSKSPYLGHVFAVPNDDRSLRSRFLLLYAGGPLAHAFATLCALLATLLATDAVSLPIVYVARGALIASSTLLLFELIPVKGSDCFKILRLLLVRTLGRSIGMATLIGQSLSGVRPKDWNKALVSLLSSDSDKTPESAVSHLLQYSHALDCDELPTAREHLASAQACDLESNGVLLSITSNEAAYISAISGDVPSAKAFLSRVDKSLPEHSLLRTKAALAEAEGNFEQARTYARQALAAQHESSDKGGGIIVEREILERLLLRVERALESSGDRST